VRQASQRQLEDADPSSYLHWVDQPLMFHLQVAPQKVLSPISKILLFFAPAPRTRTGKIYNPSNRLRSEPKLTH
jgi:hypothetical protein